MLPTVAHAPDNEPLFEESRLWVKLVDPGSPEQTPEQQKQCEIGSHERSMADMEMTPGRGNQVIKVVMPTYIMAPTEDERFRRKQVCKITSECMAKELDGKEFDEADCKTWSTSIADAVKTRISAECRFPRYKVVVQTFIGQQRLQDVRITSRCLWDNDHDNHASAVFNSQHIWATCVVFGFYSD